MDVITEGKKIQNELVELRRYFHEHPELPWEEFNTQKKIMEYLDELGIPYQESSKTGVIATIKGPHSSDKILGIRADIDALPITEQAACEWKSQNEGKMHACGHDTHITMLLGAAKLLKQMEDELTITVRLLFQPAEECIENSGAALMKDDPALLECDRLIAMHIWSKIPAGYASLRYGPVMSAADTFDIYVKGKGGHGALPHQTVDPVVAASEFVLSMQRVVARELNPLEASVISITAFNSGTTSNVIPAEAHLMGTARTFTPATRDQYPEIIKRVAAGVGEATRTEIEVDTGRRAAETVFGKDHLTDWELQMGGEDFAKYPQEKCLLLLGGGWPEEERQFPQHSPFFDIDESALSLGVEYFVEYVQEYQKELS